MNRLDYIGLTALFTRYYRRLVDYAGRYVGSTEQARDLVQDCFVRLWEQKENYSDSHLAALLFRMVKGMCMDCLRHRYVEERFASNWLILKMEEEKNSGDSFFQGEEQALFSKLYKEVCKEVSGLSDSKRRVFELSWFEGLSNKEIATRLGISEAAVSKSLSESLRKLSKVFSYRKG